jgi:hypothetical protein
MVMSAREDFLALEQIRRDTISVPRAYIDIAGGDIASGVMLAQLLYWFGDTDQGVKRTRIAKDGRDWIAKRWDEWHKECRLSPDQARRCVENLLRLNLIDKEVWRFNGSPTVHLSLNFDAVLARHREVVAELVAQMDLVKTPGGSGQNPRSIPGKRPDPLTEITTDTTTEKKARKRRLPSLALPSLPKEIDTTRIRAAWDDFVQMRKEKGKSLTPQGAKNLLSSFATWGEDQVEVALRLSIQNSWTGVFLPKPGDMTSFVQSAPKPKPDPEAIARADRKAARDRAEDAYRSAAHALTFYPGSTDNWTAPAACWLYDGLDALQEPSEFQARLTHARALIERLRALGAFPLVKAPAGTSPGLIFPACGGGPWKPSLTERGFVLAGVDLHFMIVSPQYGPIGCLFNPSEEDKAYALKEDPGTHLQAVLASECPACAEERRLPVIDDPDSPKPLSAEEVFCHGAPYTGMIPATLTPLLSVPGDTILIDGDPVSREAIERNYGPNLRPKEDDRPPCGCWAPGSYTCVCATCGDQFWGDKRAASCADCAHGGTGTIHDPGDGSVPTYFPGPGKTDAPTDEEAEVAERWLSECCYPGRCLCPHYDHESWECFTVEDAEDEEFERQCNADRSER